MSSLSFEELVTRSVGESISKTLGEETWRAVNFYFDTKMVAKEPEKFVKVLGRLFGPTSKILEKVISDVLLAKAGFSGPRMNDQDFLGILQLVRARLTGFQNR